MLLGGAVPLVSGDRRKFGQMKSRGGKSKRREEKRREEKRKEEKRREEKKREEKRREGKGREEEEEEEEEEERKRKRKKKKRREEKRKKIKKRESLRRKKIQVREKVGKSRNTMFFQWFVAPEEKLHPVVARSTFRSQNAQNTPGSDHFWKLRCRKSARRCGVKHISKSKCTKHNSSGPLLEVEMSKKCTPLWRKAHFEVKSAKNLGVRSIFGRSNVVSRGRRRGLCTLSKVSKTWNLQVCWNDFAWPVQHFVWPGITFSWQAQ